MNRKINVNVVGVGVLDDPHTKGKTQKGITLIALVITIIVLLILAGVTINMVLGDDGIIAQAQAAKEANEEASLKDAVEIAKGEAALATYNKQIPMSDNDLNTALGKTEGTITGNKSVAKVVDRVPIPVGFAYVEGTKKDTGLIVVDGYGNEFVWVPVTSTTSWTTQPGIEPSDGKGTTDSINDDFDLMKASVNIYNGFYVGRYETSYNGTRVASVGNVIPLYQNQVIDGDVTTTWYTFYTKQKELYSKESSSSVVSGMIYEEQWDAIMDWMSDVKNPNAIDPENNFYINDSTGMGAYSEGLINTGSNLDYRVKNIFDLAGNYLELTQRSTSVEYRCARGGYYWNEPSTDPASSRIRIHPYDLDECISSRLQLYIK